LKWVTIKLYGDEYFFKKIEEYFSLGFYFLDYFFRVKNYKWDKSSKKSRSRIIRFTFLLFYCPWVLLGVVSW